MYYPSPLRIQTYKGSVFALDVARHLLANEAIANVGDATGLRPSATAGNLWMELHYGEPFTLDAQTANEADYVGYSRTPLPRTSAKWITLVNQGFNSMSLQQVVGYKERIVYFPELTAFAGGDPTGTKARITHVSVGAAQSGAGLLMYVYTLPEAVQMSKLTRQAIPALLFTEC